MNKRQKKKKMKGKLPISYIYPIIVCNTPLNRMLNRIQNTEDISFALDERPWLYSTPLNPSGRIYPITNPCLEIPIK